YSAALKPGERTGTHSSFTDDRLVFTEEDAGHHDKGIAALAAAARVLNDFDPPFARECLATAESAWTRSQSTDKSFDDHIAAAVELLLTTHKPEYENTLLENRKQIVARIDRVGWSVARVANLLSDKSFVDEIRATVKQSFAK